MRQPISRQRLVAWVLCGVAVLLILIGGITIGSAIAGSSNDPGSTPPSVSAQRVPGSTQSVSDGVSPSPTQTKQGSVTQAPTHAIVRGLTPIPTSTQHVAPTHCNGVCPNPWGYTLGGASQATQVTNPPPTFCEYFPCIPNFWNGHGSVLECGDGLYSHSGNIQGACSGHNGYIAYLYNPLGPNPQPSPTLTPDPTPHMTPSPYPTFTPYPSVTPTA